MKNIEKLTYSKVEYVHSILRNGYYQMEGLGWLLRETVKVEKEENERWSILADMSIMLGLN